MWGGSWDAGWDLTAVTKQVGALSNQLGEVIQKVKQDVEGFEGGDDYVLSQAAASTAAAKTAETPSAVSSVWSLLHQPAAAPAEETSSAWAGKCCVLLLLCCC